MTDRKLFGVGVRLVGLYLGLYMGVLNLFSGIGCLATGDRAASYFIMGILATLMGIALIKAEWLVRLAYGESVDPTSFQSTPPN